MALVRQHAGFRRYVFSVCYDGDHHLGFSYQGPKNENCITAEGTDLRALHSVEGRIRTALKLLVGERNIENDLNMNIDIGTNSNIDTEGMNFENFQVSSRTDRGVHALHNTFHADIRTRDPTSPDWKPQSLVRGLNYHLVRGANVDHHDFVENKHNDGNMNVPPNLLRSSRNAIRITSSCFAPSDLLPNKHYNSPGNRNDIKISEDENEVHVSQSLPIRELSDIDYDPSGEPSHISWNARFTATSRTYIYRMLVERLPNYVYTYDDENLDDHNDHSKTKTNTDTNNINNIIKMEEYGYPFEAGTSWRIRSKRSIDIKNMEQAAAILVGTHDFSSFRGRGCYRLNPITCIEDIRIKSAPLLPAFTLHDLGLDLDLGFNLNKHQQQQTQQDNNAQLVTIAIKGNAFLYRQVRNIVGCLAEVGIGKLRPETVKDILDAKDRKQAPQMAPAHGLFLARVEHFPPPSTSR